MANTHRTLDQIRQSSDAEHRRNAQAVAAIRADANLSQQGKKIQVDAEQRQHESAMAALRSERQVAQGAMREEALHSLWGFQTAYGMSGAERAANLVAYRDAIAKASTMTPQQAAKAFALANITGDSDMKRAIALQAHQEGWNALAEAWAKEDTSRLETYNALVAMEAPPSATEKLAAAMNFSASAPPKDLIGHVGANAALPPFINPHPNNPSANNAPDGGTGAGNGSGA